MKSYLIQFKIFRKLFRGKFYRIKPLWYVNGYYWTDHLFNGCEDVIVECEEY